MGVDEWFALLLMLYVEPISVNLVFTYIAHIWEYPRRFPDPHFPVPCSLISGCPSAKSCDCGKVPFWSLQLLYHYKDGDVVVYVFVVFVVVIAAVVVVVVSCCCC